jgi:IS4 transposase
MAALYKGYSGNAGEAGIGIQYEYDVKSGKTLDLSIVPASRNDREDARTTAENVEENDLIIRDLGYFSTRVFDTFSKHKAYFLSRLDSDTAVIEAKSRKRISFDKLYKDMQENKISLKEIDVLIGEETYFPVRLIAQIVPDNVYEQRIRNRKEGNKQCNRKKQRRTPSAPPSQVKQETKARYHFSLYITNADNKLLPAKDIAPLYRLRWQIELMFKSWKGVFHVNNIHPMKKERYMCLLYAKLLLIFIDLQIIYKVQEAFEQKKKTIRILSLNKSFKTLHALFSMIMKLWRAGRQLSHKIACKIQEILLDNHWLDKRKNKLSLSEIFDLFICKSIK